MHNQSPKVNTLRYAEYYEMQPTQDKLYQDAKNGKTFNKLMDTIRSERNILMAYRNVKRNTGSRTAGVDGMTIHDIEKIPTEMLVQTIQAMQRWYNPQPVRRVDIPKPNGQTRPLGIPTLYDRIVQQSILQILEPICEAKFYDHSYGFRPDRSAENAIARSMSLMQRSHLHFVVSIDIKGFFDNVNHTKLMQQMWALGIRDKTLLSIIKAMLKAKIKLADGSMYQPTKGTPQGGVQSPLLANIVLNELDWWISSQWETMPTHKVRSPLRTFPNGHQCVDRSHAYEAFRRTSSLKEMHIVRYADDFKIFCRNHDEAKRIMHAVTQWLHERLKLEVSPDKTGITNTRKKYTEFLGIKLRVHRNGARWTVQSHMTDKAQTTLTEKLRAQIKRMQHPSDEKTLFREIDRYNAMVIGAHNYYQMATCISQDCSEIAWRINRRMKNRLDISRSGTLHPHNHIAKRYGKSKQLRFLMRMPIAPISYCRTKDALHKPSAVNRYTPEGRAAKHKNLGVDISKLLILMEIEPKGDRSIEYYDNRISVYAAQCGRCAITGQDLEIDDIHCHHIIPVSMGGTDRYANLKILHRHIHTLVHTNNADTTSKYMHLLTSEDMYQKLNTLRRKCGNPPIIAKPLTE